MGRRGMLLIWGRIRKRRRARAMLVLDLFVDENGDHLTDENGNRLGES